MDIHEIADHYDISLKKLRRLHKDGHLKVGKSATPKYWQMVVSDIRKGKMSARSIALAYRFPKRLEELIRFTPRDRKTLREHFELAGIPFEKLDLGEKAYLAPVGAAESDPRYLEDFVTGLKKMIPPQNVYYEFIAVRWLTVKCDFDVNIANISNYIPRALFNAREDPSFAGWWHKEAHLYGKHRMVYHRPVEYDL